MSESSKKGTPQMVNAAQYLGYGLQWAMSTALFLVGGYFMDRWLGTLPLFLIAGAFVGAGAGFYSLYWHLVIEPRREREARDLRQDRPGSAGEGGNASGDGRGR